MYENPYASSLETRIFSATPIELVKMLYQAAIEEVQSARLHLNRGEIHARSRAVTKAIAILAELRGSLDHEKGGELSTRLAEMYDYLQRVLLDANFRQADDGLEAAEKLLKTLDEAWSAINAPRSGAYPRSGGFAESHPSSYSPAGNQSPVGEYAPRLANQWCA